LAAAASRSIEAGTSSALRFVRSTTARKLSRVTPARATIWASWCARLDASTVPDM
jgi:hypothetical protein